MEIPEVIKLYLGSLVSDFLRYFIAAGATYLLFWVLLKNFLSHKFIQGKFPKAGKLWHEFRYSMSTVFIFAAVGTSTAYLYNAGLTQIYTDVAARGWVWFFASIALAIVVHDAYFYWTHRFMHLPKVYKHVHLVHHKSTNPSPWAAYSFHPLEAIIQAAIGPLILIVIPMHHIAFLAFLTYMIVLNVFGHFSFELFPKGFTRNRLLFWHNTTTHHNMHHRYFNHNYSLYFNWWDRLMNTMHPKYDEQFDKVAGTKRPKTESNTSIKNEETVIVS